MAFGDVKGTLTGGNNSIPATFSATGSVSVSVGDLVFGVVGQQTNLTAGAGSTNPSDNLGNTYAWTNAGTDAGNATGRAYYSRVTTAGTLTQIDVTCTSSTNDASQCAAVFEGPFTTSPLDANPANVSNDVTTPYTGPATGTLAQADEYIIAWYAKDGNSSLTGSGSNTLRANQNQSTNIATGVGGYVVSATTTQTPAWTGTAPTVDVLGTNSFKKAAATNTNKSISVSQAQSTAVYKGMAKKFSLSQAMNVSGTALGLLLQSATTGSGLTQAITINPRLITGGGPVSKVVNVSIGQDVYGFIFAMITVAAQTGAGLGQLLTFAANRANSKLLSIAQAQSITVRRAISKIIAIGIAQTITLRESIAKRIALAQGQTISLFKSIGRRIALTMAQTVTTFRLRSTGKAIPLVTMAQTVTVRRSEGKFISILQAQSVILRKAIGARISLITQAQSVTVLKSISRRIVVTMAQLVSSFQVRIAGGGTLTSKSIAVSIGQNVYGTANAIIVAVASTGSGLLQVINAYANRTIIVTPKTIAVQIGQNVYGVAASIISATSSVGNGLAQLVTLQKQSISGAGTTHKIINVVIPHTIRLTVEVGLLLTMARVTIGQNVRAFTTRIPAGAVSKLITAFISQNVYGTANAIVTAASTVGSGLQQIVSLQKQAHAALTNKLITVVIPHTIRLVVEVRLLLTMARVTIGQSVTLNVQRIIGGPVSKAISVSISQIVTLVKAATKLKLVTVTMAQLVTVARQYIQKPTQAKLITLTQSQTVTLRKPNIGKFISVTMAQVIRLQFAIGRRIQVSIAQSISLIKSITRRISITQAQLITLIRSSLKNRIVTVTQAQLVTLRRVLGKTIVVTQAQLVSLRKTIGKVIVVLQSIAVAIYKAIRKTIRVSMAMVVSAFPNRFAIGFVRITVGIGQSVSLFYSTFIKPLRRVTSGRGGVGFGDGEQRFNRDGEQRNNSDGERRLPNNWQ